MKLNNRIVVFFLCLISQLPLVGQNNDIEYVPEGRLQFKNKVYNEKIHTVSLHKSQISSGLPIISLGGGERLELSFDDFSMSAEDLNYKIIHCDYNWEPTDLQYYQYITGLEEPFFSDFTYSTAFNQSYIHYSLSIPNTDVQFRISGNYLIYVYRNGDPSKLLLSYKFYVTENRIKLNTDIHPAFNPGDRNTKHEIDFSINHEKYQIINPADAIKVTLMQNNREDNAIKNLKPLFISNNTLDYNYNGENTFWAGNEQRFVDLRNLSQRTENIAGFVNRTDSIHVFLEPMATRRMHRQGDLRGTLYGGRQIGSTSFNHTSSTDIDYCMIYFYLEMEKKDPNGDYYIFGELSNYVLNNQFKMTYEPEKKRYRLAAYMKQGFYNWLIMYSKDGVTADVNKIEGSYIETENIYSILVYHDDITANYTKLIKYETYSYPSDQNQIRLRIGQ